MTVLKGNLATKQSITLINAFKQMKENRTLDIILRSKKSALNKNGVFTGMHFKYLIID